MEKRARISTPQTQSIGLEALREHAASIDGILTGVYGALAQRDDIAPEIMQLLAMGAARAEILADDLAALKRPVLVRN